VRTVAQGQLRTGEHDGLVEVFEQEAQRRGAVGHCVGAVQDHEAVVAVVVAADEVGPLEPVVGRYVRGVDGLVEGHHRELEGKPVQLGQPFVHLRKIERHQVLTGAVVHHAQRAAGVDHQHRRTRLAGHGGI
jgi:hypothetical protein